MRKPASIRSYGSLAAITMVMLFAAFMHLYLITSYPPGLDPDAAQDGLDALKPARYDVWPFYITINSNPDPTYIYTAAATTALFGAHALSMRFASVAYALWGLAATYACLAELGRGSFDAPLRRAIALFAVAALAASQPFAFFDRMALRFITQLPVQMLAVWALARAARTSSSRMWLLAGGLAGFTQYTYPSARVLPLLLLLVLLIKLLQERPPRAIFFKGLALYLGMAFVVLLPQIVWYAYYPHTFLARAGQTAFSQNPLYAQQGLSGVLLTKFVHYREALGDYWAGQYNQIKEPFLAPLFYYGFGLGLLACVIYFRRWFTPLVLCGLMVMILPDLISGDREWPHEFRLIGAYPFVAGVAGLGMGAVWGWARRRPIAERLVRAGLILFVGITFFQQAREFFGMDANFGRMVWGGNTWLRRVDNSVGELIARDPRPYLLPLQNYADTPVKYLTSRRVVHLQSALGLGGSLLPGLQSQTTLRLLLPRSDNDELWQGDLAQWVIIDGQTAYLLPPLDPSAMASLLPPQDDTTALYGVGSNSPIRLGHWADVALSRLALPAAFAPRFPANVCYAPGMCLVGVTYSDTHLQPGGQLRVYLHWQIARPIKEDYIMFVHLLDRDGGAIASVDEYPLSHGYRTYEWGTNETIISTTVIDLPVELAAGPYAIEAGFYPPYDLARAATIGEQGQITGDRAYLPHLKVPRPAAHLPADAAQTLIKFADELELIGYRVDSLPANSQPLRVTLWWRGLKPASQNWTGFFHLTPASDSQSLAGQLDRGLTGGAYPPVIWDAGEVVEEQIEISANGLAAGKYALWMGLYAPASFERAPIIQSPYPVQDNRTLLLEFDLK